MVVTKASKIAIFEGKRIRRLWDDLKRKLKMEGSELSEKIGQLKMQASDGKYYLYLRN